MRRKEFLKIATPGFILFANGGVNKIYGSLDEADTKKYSDLH